MASSVVTIPATRLDNGGATYSARQDSIFPLGDRTFEVRDDNQAVVIKRDCDEIHVEAHDLMPGMPGCYRLGVTGYSIPLRDLIRALGITADDLTDAYGVNVDGRGY
jgi:hypothetical protein